MTSTGTTAAAGIAHGGANAVANANANVFGVGAAAPTFAPTPILQPGASLPERTSYLPSGRATSLWGRLPSRDDAPVLTIEQGATVVIDTLSHEGLLPDQGQDPVAFFDFHRSALCHPTAKPNRAHRALARLTAAGGGHGALA